VEALYEMSNIAQIEERKKMKNLVPYWVSWWTTLKMGSWELHFPWWISGEFLNPDDGVSICAAIKAKDEQDVKNLIINCYDSPELARENIEWRFIHKQKKSFKPFTDRFPKADWMKW